VIAIHIYSSIAIAENKFMNNYIFKWLDKQPKIVEQYLASASSEKFPNSTALYLLGTLYLSGELGKINMKKADWCITKAANMGLPEAINSIGDGYYSGDIREKNAEKALEFYKKAAKLGFGPAQFNTGVMLLKNAKCKRDVKKAIFFLDKATRNRNDLGEITKIALRYKIEAKRKLQKHQ
jgi:TPR repeat protein